MRNSLVLQWLETLSFHCRGMSSKPGQGTKIPHASWHGQTTKKTKSNNRIYCEFLHISREETNGPVEKWAVIGTSNLQKRDK